VNYRQLFDARYPPETSNRRERVKIKERSKTMFIPTVKGGRGKRALTL
jgi:hypothetical protein